MRERNLLPASRIAAVLAVLVLGLTLVAGNAYAAGPNVQKRSKDQITEYLSKNNVTSTSSHSFKTTPKKDTVRGELDNASKESALKLLNNCRYIAGLDPVSLDASYGNLAQGAAFVDWSIGQLTHYPGNFTKPAAMSQENWQLGIDGARRSNIAWGYFSLNSAVMDWMRDSDGSNVSVLGHRRWCLNPRMGKVGFGAAGSYYAEYAMDSSGSGTQTKVAWPAQNMPVEYFSSYDCWSISTGTTETKENITVTLKRLAGSPSGSGSWTFKGTESYTPASTGKYFNVSNGGYGQSGCIMFRPNGIQSYQPGDKFSVTISGTVKSSIGPGIVHTSMDVDNHYGMSPKYFPNPNSAQIFNQRPLLTVPPERLKSRQWISA